MARESSRHGAGAIWLYRLLLRLYPAEFRQRWGEEMVQVFRELYQEQVVAEDRPHADGLGMRQSQVHQWWVSIRFWYAIGTDTGKGILIEQVDQHIERWRRPMQEDRSELLSLSLKIEMLLLVLPILFLISVFFSQVLGSEALMNVILFTPQDSFGRLLTDMLLVMGPAAALGLSLLATVQVNLQPDDSSLLTVSLRRTNTLHYVILVVGVLILAIFGTYLFFENLPCFMGYQASC